MFNGHGATLQEGFSVKFKHLVMTSCYHSDVIVLKAFNIVIFFGFHVALWSGVYRRINKNIVMYHTHLETSLNKFPFDMLNMFMVQTSILLWNLKTSSYCSILECLLQISFSIYA